MYWTHLDDARVERRRQQDVLAPKHVAGIVGDGVALEAGDAGQIKGN